jgi:hypothetical protein
MWRGSCPEWRCAWWICCRVQVRAPPYDNVGQMPFFKLLRHIIDTEGWRRLYRGLGSALGGAGLSWALYFAWNDWFKRQLLLRKSRSGGARGKLSALEEMCCAAVAGILTTLVVNPIWVINTRLKLAAQRREKKSQATLTPPREGHGAAGQAAGANGGGGQGDRERVGRDSGEGSFPERGMVKEVKESNTIAAVVALVRKEGLLGWLSVSLPLPLSLSVRTSQPPPPTPEMVFVSLDSQSRTWLAYAYVVYG